MNEPIIMHSDLNCFYASVEINENPSLRGKAIAVCGSVEDRHGIALTSSYPAKRCGVKTGSAVWQAKQACPELIVVQPHYELYLKYSRLIRRIYADYTDAIEPYGMDENWLSIPYGKGDVEGFGQQLANEIRKRIREEIGLTVSIGVSFSKVYAKLGSDMKKPDAVTVISRSNYQDKVYPLPVSDLLYVGRSATRKLKDRNILTIGDLANLDPLFLRSWFGVNGIHLWRFARGEDHSPVMPAGYISPIKSIGHGTTCVCDLETDYEVWQVLYELAQDIQHRLRKHELLAQGVQITVKDNELLSRQYQVPLPYPTQSPLEIASAGFDLFRMRYDWPKPVRALTIRGISLIPMHQPEQLDLFHDAEKREKRRALDNCIDDLRNRFGYNVICPASLMGENSLAKDQCDTVRMPGSVSQ